jgi:AAA domain
MSTLQTKDSNMPSMKLGPAFRLGDGYGRRMHTFAGLIACIQEQSGTPILVVLDTLNRSLRGSESSDEDMTAYLNAADAIRETFNCVVVIVHHCGELGSGIRTSSTQCATPSWHRIASKTSGDNLGRPVSPTVSALRKR